MGNGCTFIGQGHGSGGPVRMLLEFALKWAPDLLNEPSFINPITITLDHYVSIQYEDGNMPTMNCTRMGFPVLPDIKVQWCHGAPGFVSTFSKAALAFQKINETKANIYLHSAIKASNATWERGLLTKGLTYCHGVGGNAYMFLDLYKQLTDIQNEYGKNYDYLRNQCLWRAKQFVRWVLDPFNVQQLHIANPSASMFQGNHGIVMLLSQLMTPNWPVNVQNCMPGWNSCV